MNKDKFYVYENIRKSDLTNMFDVKYVIELSCDNLTREDCLDIMKNYRKYKEEYGDQQ